MGGDSVKAAVDLEMRAQDYATVCLALLSSASTTPAAALCAYMDGRWSLALL